MAAVTICSDFGAPKNKVWHCFHCFPIYFPWSDGTGCDQCKEIEENNRMGKTRDLFKKIKDTKGTFHARSDQISRSVVSDSLRPHESQHAKPPCPSPTPRVHSNSCPSSQWCHPAIILCRPLLLLPPIPPSFRVFSNESTLHMRWPKYWRY